MTTKVWPETIVKQLVDSGFDANRVLVSGAQFEEVTELWNADVTHRPHVIARCETTADVQTCVRVAVAEGLPLSVRGGGHDWTGRAVREHGLVIDMRLMRSVEVQGDIATIQGGATNLDVVTAAERAGRAAVAGTVGAVGFAALATGGGYGPFTGHHGLAVDHLVGADIVLADGRVVTADAAHEPELFWAVRGGGGNFGVITALRVKLRPNSTFRSGLVVFPLEQARDVLGGYAEVLHAAPDALTADAAMLTLPGGPDVVFVAPTWSGDAASADQWLSQIVKLGKPIMNTLGDISQSALLRGNDQMVSARANRMLATRNVPKLTMGVIDTLIDIVLKRTSPLSNIYWHHFHGAASRVPLDSTAFGERRDHLMVELIASWPDGSDDSAHRAWLSTADASLAPHALPGGYPNFLDSGHHDQIAHAYGSNAARLLAVKAQCDPTGVFAAIPLPQ